MDSAGSTELRMESTLNPMNNAHEDEEHSKLPPGFRFHPTDEELVTYYLTNKILNSNFSVCAIAEADLNKCEPWDLPAKAKTGEKEWYFFGHRQRRYPGGLRTNRATEAGYWKTTGNDREIFSSKLSALVGMKKRLVFYKGRAPKGEKTNWVMHEYRLDGKFSYHSLHKQCKDEWVVCRIFEKSAWGKSTIKLMNRNEVLDLPGSPSLPSLLESPCNTTAANDQETRFSNSESGTSAKAHDISSFSISMEPMVNSTGRHLHKFECGSSSNYSDSSDQPSEMARRTEQSSHMHNLMLNDSRAQYISAASFFSVSNMMHDPITAILDQQQADLPPPRRCSPHIMPLPLPSDSSNLGFSIDAYFSALRCSNEVSNVLVSHSAGSTTEPFFSSCVNKKTFVNNNSMGANNCVNRFQWAHDGLSQNILAQPIQDADGATCLIAYMQNDEMTALVRNRLDRSVPDQLDSSAAPPLDFDSLWHLF